MCIKILIQFSQCLVYVTIFYNVGTVAQLGNDDDPRISSDGERIVSLARNDTFTIAYPRIFFEEVDQEIVTDSPKTNEKKFGEKKSLEKSTDEKSSKSALLDENNETSSVSQIQEENKKKSKTILKRRRKKKDKVVEKNQSNYLTRKPRRKSIKKMKNIALAEGEQKKGTRRFTETSEMLELNPVLKSKRKRKLKASEPHNSDEPVMKYLHYDTTIRARYLRTTITASVENSGLEKNINVNVILPRRAIITNFETWINDESMTANVEAINGTKNVPKSDVRGINVGTQLVRARDCDAIAFSISFHGLMSYTITYEYLLERYLGFYRIPIFVHTNQWIEDLSVTWRIHEDRNLTKLQTPLMYHPNSSPVENSDESSICLAYEEAGIAELIWQPTIQEQKNISRSLNGKGKGLVGVLEVNYDVARDEDPCGEVVRQDEWFAHFYTPLSHEFSHAKHVVFVFDVSESMKGKPLEQLKIAINSSLDKFGNKIDRFTVINFGERTHATFENTEAAKRAIRKMKVGTHTNVFDGLYMGYKAVVDSKMQKPQKFMKRLNNPAHLIVFVNSGKVDDDGTKNVVLNMVKNLYTLTGAPIFALGLGPDVDRDFLTKIATITQGRDKHIYLDSDTHQQITTFFDSINRPVRTHYSAKFDPKQVITSSLTEQTANVAFHGTEILVAGQLNTKLANPSKIYVDISTHSDNFINDCEKQHLNLRESEDFVEAKFATKSSNDSSNDFPSVTPKSLGTVGKIWAFKTLMDLQKKIDLEEAFKRSVESKTLYDDGILFHQPTMCDDPLEPSERILAIALRFNFAVPGITNLIFNATVLQRIRIDPDVKLTADWKIHFPIDGLENHRHSNTQIVSIRRNFMDIENTNVSPPSCKNSVNNESGECRLISDCPDIRLYTTKKVFRKHVCKIGSTTGVCCPKFVPRPMQYIE